MFTAKPQKNRNAATTYFDEHLSHNDYYTLDQEQAGYWIGQGAERLGLKPGETVTREAFLRLCDNRHPHTGTKLTQLQLSERRIFFDFTCSAPKSVSILAVTMEDKRILQAHREAAGVALRELEAFAGTRVRKRGAMEDRTTGSLVGAAFLHTSSRALDPQLHTHFTLFNATFDPVEQRWKALQTSGMFEAIHYGTAVYRNELAKRLHGLGYRTRPTAHGFEIEDVESTLIERFSKRSQQRNAAVAAEEKRLGRNLSKNEVSHVVHKCRPRKVKDASEREVRNAQLSEIGFFEKRALRAVVAQANGQKVEPAERVTMGEAVAHALGHVFARQSVAPEHELLEAALVKGCGQIELPEIKRELAGKPELVHVGSEYSTRDILRAELGLIHAVNDGLNAEAPIAPRFEASPKLGSDQREALDLVLSSSDRITGLRGLAGSGKTTTLQELRRAAQEAGLSSVFCAPTAAATDVLRKDGFREATTLAKLLQSEALPRRSVIVCDEAGFVGTSDMGKLFHLARRTDSRVVLVGDTGQHAAIARGDALRVIESHSGYRFGTLTQIRRQRTEEFRAIVALAAERRTAEAFRRLLDAGEVVEHGEPATLYQKAAAAYLKAREGGKAALLVSPTWAEIEAVTAEVRAALRQRGDLAAKEEIVTVFDPLGWTDAEKQLVSHYAPGLQLRFVKNTAQFKAGESAEIAGQKGKQLRVRRGDGREIVFLPSRSPSSFEVGQKREIAVAAGDVLLLRANAPGFVNGEQVQVKSIKKGRIALEGGRELPAGYRTFSHGYAVTSQAAQGKTVDEVLLVASSRSFAAVSQESFYVGISRARERARVFTDDAELLGRRVEDSHTRKAAVELDGLRDALAKAGFKRTPVAPQTVTPQTPRAAFVQSVGRAWRTTRTLRVGRLAPAQRVAEWAYSFRQWLDVRFGVDLAQRATLRPEMPLAERPDPPRQSRGIRM
jgi:conjugative relaxase-like TrwC/TraI family protein